MSNPLGSRCDRRAPAFRSSTRASQARGARCRATGAMIARRRPSTGRRDPSRLESNLGPIDAPTLALIRSCRQDAEGASEEVASPLRLRHYVPFRTVPNATFCDLAGRRPRPRAVSAPPSSNCASRSYDSTRGAQARPFDRLASSQATVAMFLFVSCLPSAAILQYGECWIAANGIRV